MSLILALVTCVLSAKTHARIHWSTRRARSNASLGYVVVTQEATVSASMGCPRFASGAPRRCAVDVSKCLGYILEWSPSVCLLAILHTRALSRRTCVSYGKVPACLPFSRFFPTQSMNSMVP